MCWHVLVGVLWAAAAPAEARAVGPVTCPQRAVDQARVAYEKLDYAGAVKATDGVETCQDGTPAELAEAIRWRAQALAADGSSAAATEAFAALEVIAAGSKLDPFLSPKIHSRHQAGRLKAVTEKRAFARLLRPVREQGQTVLRYEVYDAANRLLSLELQIELEGARQVLVARVERPGLYRVELPEAAHGEMRAQLKDGARSVLKLPPAAVPVVVSDAPVAVALVPAPSPAPRAAIVKREEPTGSRTVLIAGGIAVGVVAAAVVVGVLVATQQPPPLRGSMGNVEVP